MAKDRLRRTKNKLVEASIWGGMIMGFGTADVVIEEGITTIPQIVSSDVFIPEKHNLLLLPRQEPVTNQELLRYQAEVIGTHVFAGATSLMINPTPGVG